MGTCDGGGDGLIELMRRCKGDFTHRGHSADVGEICLQVTQSLAIFLGLLPFRHINVCTDNLQRLSCGVEDRMEDGMNVADGAVGQNEPKFASVVCLFPYCLLDPFGHPRAILRVHALQHHVLLWRALLGVEGPNEKFSSDQ